MFFLKRFLHLNALLGTLCLAACVGNTGYFNLPTNQLTQSLSHSTVRIQKENNQLKITLLVDQAFLPGGSHLTPETKKDLFKIVQTLHSNPELKVNVFAYTDNHNSPRSSQLVSLRRAMMVADFFRNNGIASNRISIHGMGSKDPIATNATAQGRTVNRRIEIILYHPDAGNE